MKGIVMVQQLIKMTFAACVLFSSPLYAGEDLKTIIDDQQQFDTALALYDSGKYKESAAAYESLLQQGKKNGHVLYNLALAHFRAGDFGRSMGAILEARNLLPRDPDVRSNLKFLEARIQDKLSATPDLDAGERVLNFWVGGLNVKEVLTTNMIVCIFAAAFLVIAFTFSKMRPYRLRSLWVLLLPLLTLSLVATKLALERHWASIAADGVKVFSGPGASNTLLFNLNSGAPVQISGESNAGFRVIRLSDGKKGWVAEGDLAVF